MLLAFSFQIVHKQTPRNTDSNGKEWYFKNIFHAGKNTLMLSGHAGLRYPVCPVKNTGAVPLNHILPLVYLNAVHFSAVHLLCGALICHFCYIINMAFVDGCEVFILRPRFTCARSTLYFYAHFSVRHFTIMPAKNEVFSRDVYSL